MSRSPSFTAAFGAVRLLGPQEPCERFPTMGTIRFSDQICQQRLCLYRSESRDRFAVQRDLEGSEERQRKVSHSTSSHTNCGDVLTL